MHIKDFSSNSVKQIESDQQERNQRKLSSLRNQFPVLKKINKNMSNNDKLLLFLRDLTFKIKVQQIFFPNNTTWPLLKVYLVSTRFQAQIDEQFDENDIINSFQKFGHFNQIFVSQNFAYILYHQPVSLYLALKVMNDFYISQKIRLKVRLCYDGEIYQAQSLFFHKNYLPNEPSCPSLPQYNNRVNNLKFIAKFQFYIQSLPEFNIAQRIIGPNGCYLKKIIDKVVSRSPQPHNFTMSNIGEIFKLRLRGKGSGFEEDGKQSQQKMHLSISSKYKWMLETTYQEIEGLLLKILQDFRVAFQKTHRKHAQGLAYRIIEYQGQYYTELKKVFLEQIELTVDLIGLQNQQQLAQTLIEEKLKKRQLARKNGNYQEADQIRKWLKSRGVTLIDPKVKRGKTTWSYIKL